MVAWFGKQLYCLFGPILARVLSLQYCGDLLIIRLYFVTLYNIFSYLQSFVALAILQKLAAQFQEGRCVTLTTALCCVLPLSPWRGNPRNWDAHEAEEGAPLFMCHRKEFYTQNSVSVITLQILLRPIRSLQKLISRNLI